MGSNLARFGAAGPEGQYQTSGTPFAQQGQVDWLNFGKTSYVATFETLQRLARAEIQPATHGAGIALGNQFSLGPVGQARINETLNKLVGVPAWDNVLYFGFGYESFVRMISTTQIGVNCLVLCSALCEVHSLAIAAWTLAALWKVLQFPDYYEPSHVQFLALARACSGFLSGTTFSETAELMLGDRRHTVSGNIGTQASVASPESIAEVLNGLFKVSRRDIESITVFGGWECSFVAAMSICRCNVTVVIQLHNTC